MEISVKQAIVLADEEEEDKTAATATPAAAAPAPPAAVLPHHTPPHGSSSGPAKAPKATKKPRAAREIVVLKVTVKVKGVTSAAGTLDQMVDLHPLTDKKGGDKNMVRLNGSWKVTLMNSMKVTTVDAVDSWKTHPACKRTSD